MTWGIVLQGMAAVGGLTGLALLVKLLPEIRKMRSETRKTDVDAAVAEAAADDAHLKTLVDALVNPLRDEVTRLRGRIESLEGEVETLRGVQRRYFRLLDWARSVIAWAKGWHADAEPPLPTIPPEIAEDL